MQIFTIHGIWNQAQVLAMYVFDLTPRSAQAQDLDSEGQRLVEHGGKGDDCDDHKRKRDCHVAFIEVMLVKLRLRHDATNGKHLEDIAINTRGYSILSETRSNSLLNVVGGTLHRAYSILPYLLYFDN